MRVLKAAVLVVGLGAIVFLVLEWPHFLHWAAVHTGTVKETGPYYGAWSGWVSDVGEVTLIAAIVTGMVTAWRVHECHTESCHRWGRHPTHTGTFRLCSHHHPTVPEHLTLAHIHAKHHESRAAAGLPPPGSA